MTLKTIQYLCVTFTMIIIVVSILPINTILSFNDKNPLLYPQQQKQDPVNENIKIYNDKKYGIQFEYPSNVEIIEDRFITTSDLQLLHVFFEGPFRSPYLTLKIYPLIPDEKTLDDFTSRIIKIKETPSPLNNNISILKSNATTFAEKLGHQLEYINEYYLNSGNNNNNSSAKYESKNLSIWTIKDNNAYELEFTGTIEKYNKHLPVAERIIKSFQIK
jgi:eukaryotic-like serine/threonine-protein kinase